MIKRIFFLLLTVIFALSASFVVSAEGLPFDGISAVPERLHFLFSYPNEGSESIEVVFLVSDEICELRARTSEEQEKYYGSAYECCIQYDWSVDSRGNWNYNESWDTLDGDYPFQRLTGSFVEKQELFWFTYDETAERFGNVLKTEQTLAEIDGITKSVTVRKFDFDKHELFVRARFFIYEYSTNTCYVGDWSDIYSVNDVFFGKETPKEYKGDKKGVSPDVSSARKEENTLRFDVSFDDSTKEQAYLLKCAGYPDFTIESQIRLNDGEWEYWLTGNELYPYVVGNRNVIFTDSQLAGKIEYRCRLIFNEVNDLPGYNSGWSDIITLRNGEVEILKNDDPFDKKTDKNGEPKSDKCGVCGICPVQPLSICMFIWIGLFVIIALIVVYNVVMLKKKKKKKAETLRRQQESRSSETKAEESIINIDLTPKIKENEASSEEEK